MLAAEVSTVKELVDYIKKELNLELLYKGTQYLLVRQPLTHELLQITLTGDYMTVSSIPLGESWINEGECVYTTHRIHHLAGFLNTYYKVMTTLETIEEFVDQRGFDLVSHGLTDWVLSSPYTRAIYSIYLEDAQYKVTANNFRKNYGLRQPIFLGSFDTARSALQGVLDADTAELVNEELR